MTADEELEDFLRQVRLSTTAEQDERILGDALAAIDPSAVEHQSAPLPTVTDNVAASTGQPAAFPLRTMARRLRRHWRLSMAAACVLAFLAVLPRMLPRTDVSSSGEADEVAVVTESPGNPDPPTLGTKSVNTPHNGLGLAARPKTDAAGTHRVLRERSATSNGSGPATQTKSPAAAVVPGNGDSALGIRAAALRYQAFALQARLVARGSKAGMPGVLDSEQTVAKSPLIYKLRLTQVLEDLRGKVFRKSDPAAREILLEAEVLRAFKGDPKAAGQRVVLVWDTVRGGPRLDSCLHAEQVLPKHAAGGEAVYLMALTVAEPAADAEGRPRLKNVLCPAIRGTRVSKADVDPKKWATAKNTLERLKLELLSALDDADSNTRHSAIKGLRRWDGHKLSEEPPGGPLWKDKRAAARILAAGRDADWRVRWVVAWMIPKQAGREGEEAMVRLLSDTHRDVRQVAASVLRRRGREDLVKPLSDEPPTDPPPVRGTIPEPPAEGVDDHGWPSKGLVAKWSGEGDARDSAGENHGKAVGPVKYATGVSGLAFRLDGKSAHINMGSPAALQITGNQTIAMWLNPDRLGVRQNPLAKAVGGEGTMNVEPDGRMNYYYGISGGRSTPYASLSTSPMVKVGRWQHVAVVRDFNTRTLTWYVNGIMKRQGPTKYGTAKASAQPLYIGKGYVSNFCGLIDEVGIWNRALSATEIARVANSGSLVGRLATTASQVDRETRSDRIVLDDGTVLKGVVGNHAYELTTSFGKINVPAKDVIGLLPAGSRLGLVLADGQVLVGEPSQTLLAIDLSVGTALKVPVARIRQCGYRITKARPAGIVPSGPMIALRGGQWLALAPGAAPTLRLATPYATVVLPPDGLLRIEPARDASGRHRAVLPGGSTFTGVLASQTLKLKLALGPVATVRPGELLGMTGTAKAEVPADTTVMTMQNGDRLIGTLTHKKLTVRTEFGLAEVFPVSVLTATFNAARPGAVVMAMWDGSIIRGLLVEKTLAFTTAGGGPAVKVALAHVASIARPVALPDPGAVAKVERLIAQLASESYKDREAATKELVKMGKGIVPLLKKHRNDPDTEVRERIEGILRQYDPKWVKPTPPPGIRPRRGTRALQIDRL